MKVKDIVNYHLELMASDSPDRECPICKRKYGRTTWSISRKDNKTEICCRCGLIEAFQDYLNYKKGEKANG